MKLTKLLMLLIFGLSGSTCRWRLCDFELRQESIGCFLVDLVELPHAGDLSLSPEGKRNRASRWPGDDGALEVSAARDRGHSGEPTACIHTTNHFHIYTHFCLLYDQLPSFWLATTCIYMILHSSSPSPPVDIIWAMMAVSLYGGLGNLWELFWAVLCMTVVHNDMHKHMSSS